MVRMGVNQAQRLASSASQEVKTVMTRMQAVAMVKAHTHMIRAWKLSRERRSQHHTCSLVSLLCCRITVAMDSPHIQEIRRPMMR